MNHVRLVFVDLHPLEPFLVRSFQFASRAVSVARSWPGPVDLWLPAPSLDRKQLQSRVAMPLPDSFQLRIGPRVSFKFGPLRVRSTVWFHRWLAQSVRRLGADDEACVFYFRTLRLANAARPVLGHRFPYVFEPHQVFFESARKPERPRQMESAVYNSAAHLFPISHSLRDGLEAKLRPKAPMTVSPLGHSGTNFNLPPYDPQADPSFLYIGSLHGWKGLETAFSATRDFGIPFDVVGDAGGLVHHRQRCEQAGYRHVVFHGTVPPEQLSKFYSRGAICLLPLSNDPMAKYYTSPLKLFEYMAAGRPIVAADLPTIREIVTDRVHARLVAVGDVTAFTNVLRELLNSPAEAGKMAHNARKLAESCTWHARAQALVPVLEGFVKERFD